MKTIKNNRKGITPIIAVVLLLMMTVAASGAAFFWFVRIQSEMQGGTEAYQQELTEKVTSKVDVITTQYTEGDLHIYLINHGNNAVPIDSSDNTPTTNWILYDSNNDIVCASDWEGSPADCTTGCDAGDDLEIGEIRKIVLNLGDPCDDISSYSAENMFSYTIDFSSVVGTGAQFVK